MSIASPRAILGLPEPLEIVELIHGGRQRSVYRVHDRTSGLTAALKIAHGDAGDEAKRAIGEEFLLLDRVRHPHLVRVFRFIHLADGSCGYVMESLVSDDARGPEAPGWVPRDPEAARSILGALHCLHAIGYAHLDLKPSQILRGGRGVVLVDLGLAAPIGSPLPARGTWGFIAPELLSGAEWDRRADIYELGCLLVNVWTGETPLGGGEMAEQIRRQQKRPRLRLRERVPGFPEGLDRVVESFLDPDPSQRPSNASSAWESLHMMAGARERYLERRRLPLPDEIPLVLPTEIEAAWDEALGAREDRPWVIEGPAGSGRHRLIQRLAARAEVLGAHCERGGELLRVEIPGAAGAGSSRTVCRIGRARPGEKIIALGAVGGAQARAALEAYGMPGEGHEEDWTLALLKARLEERLGGEEARRRGGRIRRSLAAAQGAEIPAGDRCRLAEAIVAVTSEEAPRAVPDDPLARGGWLRVGPEGRLEAAIPPWDAESLRALSDDAEIEGAHRTLLARGGNDPFARARHALGAHDSRAVVSSVPAGVDHVRERGDLASAITLLSEARAQLGSAIPADWLALHAALALEDGAPARCLPLLQVRRPDLAPEWRTLIEAHLHNRAGRRQEAIDTASPLIGGSPDGRVRRAAGAIVVRALISRGDLAQATSLGMPLLVELDPAAPAREKLRLAALLFDALTAQGLYGKDHEVVRRALEEGLSGSGLRERLVAAGSLGLDAFRRGDFAGAQALFQVAYSAALQSQDSIQIAGARANLGGVTFEAGMLAESEDLNRLALVAYEELQDTLHAAVTRRNLAAILQLAGRWGEALDFSRAARESLESIGAQDEADSALGLEAGLLRDSGLLEASAEAFARGADRLASLPQPIVEAILLRDWGRLDRLHGRCDEARRRWRQSLRIAESVQAADEQVRTLLEWASAEVAWGDAIAGRELRDRLRGGESPPLTGETSVRRAFVEAALDARVADPATLSFLAARLAGIVDLAAHSGLRPWTWRCHAALAGVASRAGDAATALAATTAARDALRELLEAIGTPALQESFVMSPDPRLFLAWCERDSAAIAELPKGSSDLEVFLR